MEWSCKSTQHISKWKGGSGGEIHTVRMFGDRLISAGTNINLWDLKTKKLLKRFQSHTSPVIELIPLAQQTTSDGSYFVSAESDHKIVNVWKLKGMNKKPAKMTLLPTSRPRFVDVITSSSDVTVLCLTDEGELNIFQQKLNGSLKMSKEPVEATKVVKIAADGDDAHVISIQAARFSDHDKIELVYGNNFKFAFDTLILSEWEDDQIVLVREDPSTTHVTQQVDVTKLREGGKNVNVKNVLPGQVGDSQNNIKRKRQISMSEVKSSMEEQLAAISKKEDVSKDKTTNADSLAQQLSQGLKSGDKDILNQVLQHSNESLIAKTVGEVEIDKVLDLIEQLYLRVQGTPEKSLVAIKWLRSVLAYHTAYLMTVPKVMEQLNPLFQYMTVRSKSQAQLSRLEGKLDCMMNQVINKTRREENEDPLYVYDEDSDENSDDTEDLMEADMLDQSGNSDDDWERESGNEEGEEAMEE